MQSRLDKALEVAQEIARDVLAPNAAAVDESAQWPATGIGALRAELGGLVAPEEYGGLNLGLEGVVRVAEVLGQECASTALCFGMHCVGTAVIAARATDEQGSAFLEPIAAGSHLTTLALSEPGTGGHFWLPETTLAPTASGYVVAGQKTFVTNGSHADSYVVSTVAADPDAPPGQFSCVVVPGDAAGLVWGEPWQGIGMRGNSSLTVQLQDVAIPRTHLLGSEGDEVWYVFNVVAPYFLAAMSGTYLGLAAAALEEARSHLTARRHSHTGAALSQQPLVQHRIGTMWAQVERTRQLLYAAARGGDEGQADALPGLSSAKAEVAECAVAVANEAMSLVGGIGFRAGGSLARRLRDARAAHVMAPTTDLLRLWVGRAVLGEHILGE